MRPEINKRFNYPVKEALVQLTDEEEIDLGDQVTKYCTSSFLLQVSKIGMQRI